MTKNDKIKFLDNIAIADTAFQIKGNSIKEVFENAAKALTMSMASPDCIEDKVKVNITLQNKKLDILLFDFLNEIIFYKDSDNLLFGKYNVGIEKSNGMFELKAKLEGEKADSKKHKITTDVKAVTLHMFKLGKKNGVFEARVVVDI